MFYIGIDLGTSSVKLLLMDETGKVCKISSKSYDVSYPHPNWSEQNPYDWYEETIEGLKELLEGIERSKVKGISFGGQMHGLVILDEKDEVIRPCILWNDGRTVKECDYLNNVIGRETLSAETANIAFAGFTLPKILWLKENEPDNYARIKKIMLPKDYLIYRFTNKFVTDMSDASGMLLLDVRNRHWSEKMCEICGVKEEMLPELHESYDGVGTLTKEMADKLGLTTDVVVAAGAGDNAAAAIGCGAVGEGKCNISIGTSGTIFISTDKFLVDDNNSLHSFCHSNGKYHLMGCILSAASCNKWWMEDILGTMDYKSEQAGIEKLGENEVMFLPYLMGERTPHNDANVRGAFVSLSMSTTREQMTQAVLEGVAYAFRDSYEIAKRYGINIERTTICGGGAKSALWTKIIANVLNVKVDILKDEEGPSLGAAILSAVACGEYKSVEEAAEKIVRINKTIEPDCDLVAKYNKGYEKYKKLYPALKEI